MNGEKRLEYIEKQKAADQDFGEAIDDLMKILSSDELSIIEKRVLIKLLKAIESLKLSLLYDLAIYEKDNKTTK